MIFSKPLSDKHQYIQRYIYIANNDCLQERARKTSYKAIGKSMSSIISQYHISQHACQEDQKARDFAQSLATLRLKTEEKN